MEICDFERSHNILRNDISAFLIDFENCQYCWHSYLAQKEKFQSRKFCERKKLWKSKTQRDILMGSFCVQKHPTNLTNHRYLKDNRRNNTLTIPSKGTFQKRFSGFCPLRGSPPPYPLNGQSFSQKTLNGKGGYPPPLTESPLSFSGNFFPKRAKNDVFCIK